VPVTLAYTLLTMALSVTVGTMITGLPNCMAKSQASTRRFELNTSASMFC